MPDNVEPKDNTEPFVIDVVGETTGTRWTGKFRSKINLSHRDHLLKDKLRLDYLGHDNVEAANERAKLTATMLSEIAVRLVDGPTWWTENDNGLDLKDDNPIVSVYNKCIEVEAKRIAERSKQAEEAKKDLAEEAKKE